MAMTITIAGSGHMTQIRDLLSRSPSSSPMARLRDVRRPIDHQSHRHERDRCFRSCPHRRLADAMTAADRQMPIGSGFDADTTAQEVLGDRRLDGRTAIITGGYSGLGLETVRVLVEAGATVVVPARRPEVAREALRALPDSVELAQLDLADGVSIDRFAERFVSTGRALELLIGAAGIMATPLERDRAGNELQLSVNHLGHFRLASRLMPALRRAPEGARVVSVSSLGHQIAPVDLDDPNFELRDYDKWVAYGQSKSANALFAVALDARAAQDGIHAYSLHPGSIWTKLARHLTDHDLRNMGAVDEKGHRITKGFKTIPQGAATILFAAIDPRLETRGGAYLEDGDVAEIVETEGRLTRGVRPWAVDPTTADRLWDLSERLTAL
jgi:NAD(P)-dependent dehydrogenase (short-subunit alcohol dehydrogenase family)